ncbi:MAG: glycosyltransferase family 9 protein [Thermomicrobiales bacterium]
MIVGLDNGRGAFLTHRAPDRGFGYKHEAEYMLDVAVAAGGKPTHAIPVFNADQSPLPFDLPGSFVAVAPVAGAYSPARIWPAGKFADLCRQLADRGIKFVIVGGSDATPAARTILNGIDRCAGIDLTGKTTIGQLAATLKRASAVIGNDSFPTHLGAAVGTPVTTIFGPSNSRAWKPLSRHSTVVSAGLPCAPCLYTGYRLGRPDGVPPRRVWRW